VEWAAFDNATAESKAIGSPTPAANRRATAPAGLPSAAGDFVRVRIAAVKPAQASWAVPVDVYFRRGASGWAVVGVERLPGN
jgi:hypothetical protein